jgi:pimeloyl-ACP methyl ester carboxylesterase
MPNLEQVDFIGHSLGCRVVLETLLALRPHAVPIVRRVALMAAAVPSEMLEPGGRFFPLLTLLAAEGTRFDVLHSLQDNVLHYAFPPGQSLAGGGVGSARALGRYGPSPVMPGFRTTMGDREIVGAAHGDYWGKGNAAPSRTAAVESGNFLGIGQLGREIGSERGLGAPAADLDSREIGSSREIGETG